MGKPNITMFQLIFAEFGDGFFQVLFLFTQLIDADTQGFGDTLLIVNAMFGRAAVEESRGDGEAAKRWYEQAAERAGEMYPGLAAQARARLDGIGSFAQRVSLRSQEEIDALQQTSVPRTPVNLDETLRNLILPPDEATEG